MLVNLQDIIDECLKVQATWLHLEPIFSSEDIMRQMPKEGELFRKVDRLWRSNMVTTVKEPEVVKVGQRDGIITDMKRANEMLDTIQKGLNDYLETKRLYFARFFFLSNDELLEILSETKDPRGCSPSQEVLRRRAEPRLRGDKPEDIKGEMVSQGREGERHELGRSVRADALPAGEPREHGRQRGGVAARGRAHHAASRSRRRSTTPSPTTRPSSAWTSPIWPGQVVLMREPDRVGQEGGEPPSRRAPSRRTRRRCTRAARDGPVGARQADQAAAQDAERLVVMDVHNRDVDAASMPPTA